MTMADLLFWLFMLLVSWILHLSIELDKTGKYVIIKTERQPIDG